MPIRCKGRSSLKCNTRKCKYVQRNGSPYCRRRTLSRCAKRIKTACRTPRCKWASGAKYKFCRKTKNRKTFRK